MLMKSLAMGACCAVAIVATMGGGGAAGCSSFSADEGTPDGGPGDAIADATTDGIGKPAPSTVELASGHDDLAGIAATETTVYFTEMTKGGLFAVPLAGGSAAELHNGGAAPSAVAVAAGGDVFWCESNGHRIGRRQTASGSTQYFELTAGRSPIALGVAAKSIVVVSGVALGLGELAQFTFDLAPIASVGGLKNPLDVAVHGTNIYFTESAGGRIGKGRIGDGSNALVAQGESDCQSIAADDAGVYWARPGDGLVRAALTGTPGVVELAKGQPAPTSLASDPSHVYWAGSDGSIRRTGRRTSDAVEIIARGYVPTSTKSYRRTLALTNDYVVWLTGDGKVLRRAK